MKRVHVFLLVIVATASLLLSACGKPPEAAQDEAPARVEHLSGDQPTRVTLTADAARRLDLQTGMVRIQTVNGAEETVIPYAAIIYDTEGNTWIYTSPQQLIYMRTRVEVQSIQGNDAVIKAGLAANTPVVTVGAEELFGSETEFEEE